MFELTKKSNLFGKNLSGTLNMYITAPPIYRPAPKTHQKLSK